MWTAIDFITDLLRGTIETELVTYTSAFTYNATDGSYYRKFDPTEPQYVGNPSPEIDKAWDDLLYGQYLVISKGEAQHLENPVEYKGFYMAEYVGCSTGSGSITTNKCSDPRSCIRYTVSTRSAKH